jgi:hypothetical protein
MSTRSATWLDERSISWGSQRDALAAAARARRARRKPAHRRRGKIAAVLVAGTTVAAAVYTSPLGTPGGSTPQPMRPARAAVTPAGSLPAIARCESNGDPKAVSPGGLYRGKYQFDRPTWKSVGGRGDPARAPVVEQDARANLLMARRGTAPWPVCGGAGR